MEIDELVSASASGAAVSKASGSSSSMDKYYVIDKNPVLSSLTNRKEFKHQGIGININGNIQKVESNINPPEGPTSRTA